MWTHLHAQSLACHDHFRSYIYIYSLKDVPTSISPVVLYHRFYISSLFPQIYPFKMMLMMRYYNHLMFLLLLLGCVVVDESYASLLEGRDVPSQYSSSSSEGCKGRSNLYSIMLRSTLDKHDDRSQKEEEECLDLDLGEPSEVLRTEGGEVRVWWWMEDETILLRNAGVGLAELELEQDGLLLPNYANVPKVAYVIQGINNHDHDDI